MDDMYIPTFLCQDLIDLGFDELEALLQEAIDKDCVDSGEVPDLETVRKLASGSTYGDKQEILSIYERYPREVKAWYKDYEID